ncbi:hypothetical protein [Xanthomonas sacchari]|uniref:Uncharacterized protein n=1 Tax=Xanthomonas sacchari TaxID=56458 RepID=A0A2P5Z3A1_9XANT|nr:hypothetical protein [Xanthomonas sacchari]MDV0438861.1 hypothetical protein [Xanthomonas sacchari]PPU82129.1 hypothetical protein XsacCFBP4641_12490 [Xanthomonas sacchari]
MDLTRDSVPAGYVLPDDDAVFAMYFGAFAVWFRNVVIALRLNRILKSRYGWKRSLAESPRWMKQKRG